MRRSTSAGASLNLLKVSQMTFARRDSECQNAGNARSNGESLHNQKALLDLKPPSNGPGKSEEKIESEWE